MKKSIYCTARALTSLLFTICALMVNPSHAATPTQAHEAWGRVLTTYVNERGEVDFEALSAKREDITQYLAYVAETQLESLSDPVNRLAHMINAYNALSMFNVVDSGIPSTHAGFSKVSFFILKKHTIGGKRLSLYGFENDIIRPLANELGLPEIHFALNCSAVSCPVLPRKPFTAAALKPELEREARAFFARPENYRIDTAERTVHLNEILDFYTKDFVPAHGVNLVVYANKYAPQPAPPDFKVRFVPYDWTVANSRRKK